MNCSSYSGILPFDDHGLLRFRPAVPALVEMLGPIAGKVEVLPDRTGQLRYSTREELERFLKLLAMTGQDDSGDLFVHLSNVENSDADVSWLPLEIVKFRIEYDDMVRLISERRFTSFMQPIVNLDTEVIGYEFLLRPLAGEKPFVPLELFDVARKTGLISLLDHEARIAAVETSARWLPNGIKRFINFLPSSLSCSQDCLRFTFEAIDRLLQRPEDFVFEVVETERIGDMQTIQSIFDQIRSKGMAVALDDLGAGYSTLEVMNMLQPDYVKIDRCIIDGCYKDTEKQRQISQIVESASRFSGQVLAEGIEQWADFEFCRQAGVSLAQGYLFGKPDEKPI